MLEIVRAIYAPDSDILVVQRPPHKRFGSIRLNDESLVHAFVTPPSLRGYDVAFGHRRVLEKCFERFV